MNSNSLNRQLQESNRKNIDETQKSIPLNNEISLATNLTKEVRVLCWIMTNPKNHKTKAIHVKETWGQRCNILLFMSSESGRSNEINNNIYKKISILITYFSTSVEYNINISDAELPTIKLNLDHDSRDNLWGKTKQAFQYVYDNYR